MVKRFMELVLTSDTVFEEDIVVENSIRCTENNRFSLKVAGNIDAWNIDAGDINARDIDARNIDAWNIDARDIICESRKKKSKTSKTIARIFVQGRPKLERKEQMPEKELSKQGAK
jgi:hypothetical protein